MPKVAEGLQRPDPGSPAADIGLLKWFHKKLGSRRSSDGWTVSLQVSKGQSWGDVCVGGDVLVWGFMFVGDACLHLSCRTKPASLRRLKIQVNVPPQLEKPAFCLNGDFNVTFTEWGETEHREDTEWTYFSSVLLVVPEYTNTLKTQ